MSNSTERKTDTAAESVAAASASHTPGPWFANETPHSSNQDWVVLYIGANGHSKRVCAVYSDKDEADARLIAAAPDLLKALASALADHHNADDCDADCWSHKARAAIKRACGQ
jgi:hypothetical protein